MAIGTTIATILGVDFSPNGIVQYVYPALSTTIDIGTSDVPLGTLIVHDTM
jgi:hypothetical protein